MFKLLNNNSTSQAPSNVTASKTQHYPVKGGLRLEDSKVDVIAIVHDNELIFLNTGLNHLFRDKNDSSQELLGKVTVVTYQDKSMGKLTEVFVAFEQLDDIYQLNSEFIRKARLNHVSDEVYDYIILNFPQVLSKKSSGYYTDFIYAFDVCRLNEDYLIVNNNYTKGYVIKNNKIIRGSASEVVKLFWPNGIRANKDLKFDANERKPQDISLGWEITYKKYGPFLNLKGDLEIYDRTFPKNGMPHNLAMPFFYAYRCAAAGLFHEGLMDKDVFNHIDNMHFGLMVIIGQNISREHQVRFQDESFRIAKNIIDLYVPNLTELTLRKMIILAKKGISVYSAVYNGIVSAYRNEEEREFIAANICQPQFVISFMTSALCDPDDEIEVFTSKAVEYYRIMQNPELLQKSFSKLFY